MAYPQDMRTQLRNELHKTETCMLLSIMQQFSLDVTKTPVEPSHSACKSQEFTASTLVHITIFISVPNKCFLGYHKSSRFWSISTCFPIKKSKRKEQFPF